MAPPIITSTGQTRSRLPTKWMQDAATKSRAAPTIKQVDLDASPQESPVRWSTHTLAADASGTVRSRADSITSTCVDTFAHRRGNRISDLTFVDLVEDEAPARLPPSDSHGSSINDLSLTLNNDEDQAADLSDLIKYKAILAHATDNSTAHNHSSQADSRHDNESEVLDDGEDDDMTRRINSLMAATMEALEASNRLVLDTLSSRAKLAQLNAMEAALDSHLDAREAHLRRQIQAVTDMTDFVSRTSAELQNLTSPSNGLRIPSSAASAGQIATLSDPAEVHVRETAAKGIVQALDRDATIGKTAAKRLERMLQIPSPTASPPSAGPVQRRNNSHSSRRAFSISNFASVQSSIAEEGSPVKNGSSATSDLGFDHASPASTTPSGSHTSTPQKKRSVSYDSRAPGAMRLMNKLGVPSTASSTDLVAPSTMANGSGASSDSVAASAAAGMPVTELSDSHGSKMSTTRPSLMATLRQGPTIVSSQPSLLSKPLARQDTTSRPQTKRVSHSQGVLSRASVDAAVSSTAAESTLAALLGMSSAAGSTSSRTETPSESSYFDSAMDDSISSTSPPSPGSMHGIHGVLATTWKAAADDSEHDSGDMPSQQQRSARRASIYSNAVSPKAALSPSDRERAQQLSTQLAELRAERVTWNPHAVGSADSNTAGNSTSASGGAGGGALRALQRLNERSAAKIAGHGGTSTEQAGSKRVSLGLGLPSFSHLRPSASRSTSAANALSASATTPTSSSAAQQPLSSTTAEDAPAKASDSCLNAVTSQSASTADAEVSSSSLLGGGWRSWASWNATSAAHSDENPAAQK